MLLKTFVQLIRSVSPSILDGYIGVSGEIETTHKDAVEKLVVIQDTATKPEETAVIEEIIEEQTNTIEEAQKIIFRKVLDTEKLNLENLQMVVAGAEGLTTSGLMDKNKRDLEDDKVQQDKQNAQRKAEHFAKRISGAVLVDEQKINLDRDKSISEAKIAAQKLEHLSKTAHKRVEVILETASKKGVSKSFLTQIRQVMQDAYSKINRAVSRFGDWARHLPARFAASQRKAEKLRTHDAVTKQKIAEKEDVITDVRHLYDGVADKRRAAARRQADKIVSPADIRNEKITKERAFEGMRNMLVDKTQSPADIKEKERTENRAFTGMREMYKESKPSTRIEDSMSSKTYMKMFKEAKKSNDNEAKKSKDNKGPGIKSQGPRK